MKKLLFLQEFSLQAKGGGAAILRRIKQHAEKHHFEATVACDHQSAMNGGARDPQEINIQTWPRNRRYGIGRLVGMLAVLGLDLKARRSVSQVIKAVGPDVVHVTAHGVLFPIFFWVAYRRCNRKVVISVHDVWELSVNNYFPSWLTHIVFRACYRRASRCFVISNEMGVYLNEKYGEKEYIINHDGISSVLPITEKKDFLSFLYVGLIHSMQVKMLNDFFRSLSKHKGFQFRLGICTVSSFSLDEKYDNVTVTNYGWVSENELHQISRNYAFGLLPLSFEKKDELFYRTSLMTKIPFYVSAGLPLICMGLPSSSAVSAITKDRIGLCLTSDAPQVTKQFFHTLLSMTKSDYSALLDSLQASASDRFNTNKIMQRFFTALEG